MAQLKDLIVNGPTRLIGPAYGKISSADTVPVINSNANLAFNASTKIATVGGVDITAKLPAGGYQGPQGPNGTNGTHGKQGPQGPKGTDGTHGKQGPQGPKGTDGTHGKQGPQGPKGTDGTNGTHGKQGPQGPKGTDGTNGTHGKQGPQGPAGSNGTNGTNGTHGKQGPQGPAGSNGTNGTNGTDGKQGPQGPKGGTGGSGSRGYQGYQGPQGPKGGTGGSGANGKQGPQGPKGGTGGNGTDGKQGPQGPIGIPNERLAETDTRATNQIPNWYMTNYAKSIITEFKGTSTIGVNSILTGTYCNLTTITPWGDSSGGLPVQIATNNTSTGKFAYRTSNSAGTAWNAWQVMGAQGAQGPKGETGGNGANGKQGPQGPKGTDGTNGKQGPQGPKGTDGTNGKQGPQGPGLSVTPATGNTKSYLLGDTGLTASLTSSSVKTHANIYMESGNFRVGGNMAITGNTDLSGDFYQNAASGLYSDHIYPASESVNGAGSGHIGISSRPYSSFAVKELHFSPRTNDIWYIGFGAGNGNLGEFNFLHVTGSTTQRMLTITSAETIELNNHRLQNVGTPTNNNDAATKAYVDSVAGGGGTSLSLTTSNSGNHYLIGCTATSTSSVALSSSNTHRAGAGTGAGIYWSGWELYASSDERLKDFYGDIDVDFDKIKSLPKKYFKWKNEEIDGSKMNIGTSAQKLKEIYPELVSNGDDGTLGVCYEKLSVVALAAVDKLHEENEELKKKYEDLENRLKELEKLLLK